jgi:hypothetical protein
MSHEPIRLLEGPEASDLERSLLEAARSTAPVEYDVAAGAARFRTQLAALAAAGAVTAGAGSGVALRGKALLAKVAFKVVLGLAMGGVFAGAGVVAGMHMVRTAGPTEGAPSPAKTDAPPRPEPRNTALPPVPAASSAEPALVPPMVAPAGASPDARGQGTATHAAHEGRRSPIGASRAYGPSATSPSTVSPASGDAVDGVSGTVLAPGPVVPSAAASAQPAPQIAQPPQPLPQKPAELLNEVRAVALARSLVERDPDAALELLDKTRREHPSGYFVEERQALTVLALVRSGRQAAAREQAAAFLRTYPNGPFSDRVRAVAGP